MAKSVDQPKRRHHHEPKFDFESNADTYTDIITRFVNTQTQTQDKHIWSGAHFSETDFILKVREFCFIIIMIQRNIGSTSPTK